MNRPDIGRMINGMAQHGNVYPRNFMDVVDYVTELELELLRLQKAEHNSDYSKCAHYLIGMFDWSQGKVTEQDIVDVLKKHFA